jgi:hypothetical protein
MLFLSTETITCAAKDQIMTIKNIDRSTHRLLAEDLECFLEAWGDKHGLDVSAGGGVFGYTSGTIKIEVKVRETVAGISGAQAEFEREATFYGIDKSAFGKTFRNGNSVFKVSGANPGRSKYRFRAERSDGEVRLFAPETLQRHFPAKAA